MLSSPPRRTATLLVSLLLWNASALNGQSRKDAPKADLRPHPKIHPPDPTNDVINVPTGPHETPVPPPGDVERTVASLAQPAQLWTRGSFVSVQANLDALGNNIIGDAANEPSITVDPTNPDRMAIGWRQFDTITNNFRQAGVAYSHDGGQTWTATTLDPGQFRSDPVLSADNDGNFYYSSLSSLSSVEVFKSTDGGVTWITEVPAFGGDKQWLTVDRSGGIGDSHVYQLWNVQFTCCPPNDFTRSVNQAASFQPPVPIPPQSPKWGTMSVDPFGSLYVVGTLLDQTTHVLHKSFNAQDASMTPTFGFSRLLSLGGTTALGGGPNPGGLLGQIWVATDHSGGATHGNVYVLASVNPPGADPLDVMFIRSVDGGVNFSSPVRVNDDPAGTNAWQWFGTMSVAPNGRIDVVWNDTRNDPNPLDTTYFSETMYAYSIDAGASWTKSVPVSPMFNPHLGYPSQNKLGDYYDMVSENLAAKLAYSATFNGGQDVFFLRIDHDCNGNQIDDAFDIGDGVEPDVNGNGIPDACECTLDPVAAESSGIPRNRYLSFIPQNEGKLTAIRVTAVDLPPPFESMEGLVMWVDVPQEFPESLTSSDTFLASSLVCDPVYLDWGTVGLVHVSGKAIVPSASYVVQMILQTCTTASENSFSAAQAIATTLHWGDAADPVNPIGQPDVQDIAGVVDKLKELPLALPAVRADLVPDEPDRVVNVLDIAATTDAVKGLAYPFSGPVGCP